MKFIKTEICEKCGMLEVRVYLDHLRDDCSEYLEIYQCMNCDFETVMIKEVEFKK